MCDAFAREYKEKMQRFDILLEIRMRRTFKITKDKTWRNTQMTRCYAVVFLLTWLATVSYAQVFIDDFAANDFDNNTNGVWRPRIAAASDGSFSVAWQDYSDRPGVNFNQSGRSQIAVQRFSPGGEPLEHIHFFTGESTTLSMWLFDFLEHAELEYLNNGILLLLMQHTGRFVIGSDDIASSEVTLGAVHADGQIIKLHSFGDNVQSPLVFTSSRRQDHPRLTVTPDNLIVAILDESSYDSEYRNVAFRALDTSLDELLTREIPHDDGVGNAPHIYADAANSGSLFATVWQDGRYGNLWSISVQFYSMDGPIGTNRRVNDSPPGTAFALWPSVAMNSSGQSVIVWVDSRNGVQIFGQLFNSNGNPVGENFQISDTPHGGDIYSRPEVAMRTDGSFMVVWTDSINVPQAFRAKGRQYNANGTPAGEPYVIPSIDILSGYPDIATDGSAYYLTWMDNRLNREFINVYAKKIGTAVTSVTGDDPELPRSVTLYSAYPNPFNPSTRIEYSVPESQHVILKIFDVLGREITTLVNEVKTPGRHEVTFNADPLPSGVYLYRIEAGGFTQTRRMVLLR